MTALFHLLVGLGIFLYGMHQLESGARELSGRRLKAWILKSTRSPVSSAATGTVLTAILQSSSLVGLLVLAFASAGAIPLINAVGVLLGANLGTTFTGWMVTFLGFRLDLEQFALPLIALTGVTQILWQPPTRLHAAGKLLLGMGLLLFGLSIMKDSVAGVPEALNLTTLQGYRLAVYLLIGTAITALIQSSSAMMILTLTALNAGLISLPEAAALAIGADLGTTSTVMLGSLTGGAVKRQLAMAHLLYNLVVNITAYFLFLPLLPWVFATLNLNDPLVGLVAFHSVYNLVGLFLFVPLVVPFTRLLTRIVKTPDDELSPLVNIPVKVPETVLPLLHKALTRLWGRAIVTSARLFEISPRQLQIDSELAAQLPSEDWQQQSFMDNYAAIKKIEGEILQYIAKAQQLPLTEEQSADLNHVVEAARAIVYSCKTLKDIINNLRILPGEGAPGREQFKNQRQYHLQLYRQLLKLVYGKQSAEYLRETCDDLLKENDRHRQIMDTHIYRGAADLHAEPSFLSTQLNVNREVHHAASNLLQGLHIWIHLND